MRKHRILAGILAVALVLSLGGVNISAATGSPMTDAAEVPVPEGYCELDYLKLYAFLEMADADGVKNGMAVVSMILTCITAAMAGYALAKKRFVGRQLLFTLIVCAMALPKQVILIPLLREMSALNLYNTIWAVIFPIVGWPFGVFLMKQFSEGIPTEMLEAARIDGASEAKTFISIVLPMVKPGIGALAIFTFINSWNDYFMQLIMLSSTSNLTISLGIAKLQAENSTDFGLIMAGAALAAVPIIIIFLIFQKYFTKGIAMGAVKG